MPHQYSRLSCYLSISGMNGGFLFWCLLFWRCPKKPVGGFSFQGFGGRCSLVVVLIRHWLPVFSGKSYCKTAFSQCVILFVCAGSSPLRIFCSRQLFSWGGTNLPMETRICNPRTKVRVGLSLNEASARVSIRFRVMFWVRFRVIPRLGDRVWIKKP